MARPQGDAAASSSCSAATTTTPPVVLMERVPLNGADGDVAVVTLNRPSRLNCFDTNVATSLSRIFSSLADEVELLDQQQQSGSNDNDDDDDGRQNNTIITAGRRPLVAVILTGAGRSFCAGADLADPPNPLHQSSDLKCCLVGNPVYQMGRVGVPIIGALKGHCITGGFELALACDILIGDATTQFKDTHVKFGLAPCWGLSQKLQRIIGPTRAKYVSYTATSIRAAQALEWGLITEIVESGSGGGGGGNNNPRSMVLERAIKIAEEIGSQNSTMVRRYKRALEEGGSMTLDEGLKRERALGFAHYLQAVNDGGTFQDAKGYITDETRPRGRSKL